MVKEGFISCNKRDNKWLCSIDDIEKEVIGIRTNWTELTDKDFTVYTEPEDKCSFVLNRHGDRELVCAHPTEFEYLKRIYHLKEEID